MHTTYIIIGVFFLVLCIALVHRLYGVYRDISTHRQVMDLLVRNVDAYVLLVDTDFNVVQTNYYMLTGTPEASRPPKVGNLLRCKNGEDAGECGTHELCATCPVRAAIGQALRTEESFRGVEAPMILYTTDDHTQSVECEVSVAGNFLIIKDKPYILLTVYDISAQKRTQCELTEARLRAEESDRMKSLFLANTSHELRTPLNAIVGFSELLAADPTPEEKQAYVRIIRANNEMLLQLVNDILDLSKIEAGTLEYKMTDVELTAVMEELEGIFRMRQAADSTVRITFRRTATPCWLHTDRERLAQVVSNFLSNAVKFTLKGSIDFGFEQRENEVYIYVTDTGSGIPEEQQGQLFKRFVKIGSHKQGVGIGLAISKSIVESLGGRIGVESCVGKGSTFWFTLPGGECR